MVFPDEFELPPKMSLLEGAGPQSYTKSPQGRQAAASSGSKKGEEAPGIALAVAFNRGKRMDFVE